MLGTWGELLGGPLGELLCVPLGELLAEPRGKLPSRSLGSWKEELGEGGLVKSRQSC